MAGGALLKAAAIHAERLGFSTLWVPEHVVLLSHASKYPYCRMGNCPRRATRRFSIRFSH